MPRPFLKWAGGKTQLLPELHKRIPKKFGKYFEPFLGGGALFFDLWPARAYLSDMNGELISTYAAVRDDVIGVLGHLRLHAERHSEEHYYAVRAQFRSAGTQSDIARAAQFIYLNKTGFNGLWRVNRKGEYNVTWGKRATFIPDIDGLLAASKALHGTQLSRCPFSSLALYVRPGDFVYFDPPYVPTSDTANFTAYTAEGFTFHDQATLRDLALDFKARGVHVLISNAATPETLKLYADFKVDRVPARRNVNSKGDRRGPVDELLIT